MTVAAYRAIARERSTDPAVLAATHGLSITERSDQVTVFSSGGTPRLRTVFLHGGGLLAGNRFDGLRVLAPHLAELEAEAWAVEYPLAPEVNYDAIISAIMPVLREAASDGTPVVLAGQSAGGGLAASVALKCRDEETPLVGVMLICPMLDARATASAAQYVHDPSWSTQSNESAWAWALAGSDTVKPGEREDLAGLPPVFLDAGSAEVFRDSITRFATQLWSAGVKAELHVWSGGYHGFDADETAPVSAESHRARREWLRRLCDGGL